MAQEERPQSRIPNCDAYFEAIQSKKKLPFSLQEFLTSALAKIPVSSFPQVPGGQVIEIPANTSVVEAVRILSEHNIMAAPVKNPEVGTDMDWREKYLGIIDYSAIIFWVLENAEVAAEALSAAGSTTAAGVGAGALGALGVGAVTMGATGPLAVAGLVIAAVGATVAGGLGAAQEGDANASTAADGLGEDSYRVPQEEPFKSATVGSIVKSYFWAPFLPVEMDSSMLTVLLLLSKYRLRNVPVIEVGKPLIKNFITQLAVVQGLKQCKGSEWFDRVALHPLSDFGLPFMTYNEVISIKSDELILEAFKRMKDNQICGLLVMDSDNRKIVGSVSIRDIRFLLLRPGLFSNLREITVINFMRTIASSDLVPEDMNVVAPPMTCKLDDSLGSVIESLASRSAHRVYVVEGDDSEVIGVVTLRDVISCFIYEPPDHFDKYFESAMKEMTNR